MHPTGPLAIWVLVAIACAALLTVEGALFLSGRQRRGYGWRLGVSLILGSLIASALAARLFDIRAGLIYGPPLQWTDPRITTPLALATVLGSALLLLTAYGGVRGPQHRALSSCPRRRGPWSESLVVLVEASSCSPLWQMWVPGS